MKISTKFNRLIISFKQLQNRLECESENNWLKAIQTINQQLERSITDSEKKNAIEVVGETFRSLYAGNGSFSDYSIWRDDPEERIRVNKEYSLLVDEIWSLIK